MINNIKSRVQNYQNKNNIEFITSAEKFIFNKPIIAPNLEFKIPEIPKPYKLPDIIKCDKLLCNVITCPTLKKYVHPQSFKYETCTIKKTITDEIESKLLKVSQDIEIGKNIFINDKIYQRGPVCRVIRTNPINPVELLNKKIIKVETDIYLPQFELLFHQLKFKKKGLYFRFHIFNTSKNDIKIIGNDKFIFYGRKYIPRNTINEYYLNILLDRADLFQLSSFSY